MQLRIAPKKRASLLIAGLLITSIVLYLFFRPVRDRDSQRDWLRAAFDEAHSIEAEAGVLAFTSGEAARQFDMTECFALNRLQITSDQERSTILQCLSPESGFVRHQFVYSQTHGWIFRNDFERTGWISVELKMPAKRGGNISISVPLKSVYLSADATDRRFPCIVHDHGIGEILYGICRGPNNAFWNLFHLEDNRGQLSLPFTD
ncbi:MAG: hypothetical protein Fues2KO_39540 [Fuerstiella sp.]